MRGRLSSIHLQVAIAYGLLAAVILALVAGAVLGGRAFVRANTIQIGELRTMSQTVDGAGASAVDAVITLAFGQMTISGGAEELLEMEFTSNVDEMQPNVFYTVDRGLGDLIILPAIPSGIPDATRFSEYRNEWDLRLNDDTPLDLELDMGSGQAHLNLRGMALTGLDVEMGAGDITVDLRGDWQREFSSTIETGTGKATILLPAAVGVRVAVERGIGAVDVSGLEKVEDVYVNPAYGKSDITLDITVEVGAGEVSLQVLSAEAEYDEETQ